ncbi:hypothetical protein F441_06854 [Phytophthora nicotianae CJ01A1]|uniref:Uncharacterized protein n=4 Tax=Phytophthora nicotianae TaxID=4792 RepID=W2RFA4_PHYN3|nr:hypothetical protein PPTG_20992 [Phytophthora nicotianae INRA-310]ETI49255.1 hypothetical protein F443_06851 [Phytophthora nicotianae P1569]ETK89131.1 hypothetical protein L915_06718 [Phytophthora nicotianae]ETP19000.1 hypothetical protein F441_06854 [Phytophthora nicotianae CJ01A1]ETL95707.1 hypothetical protein L917_06534 [Phytophthora nicotianae]ETM48910.1 hypothetical protein L914_06635 [Phytophthora nicotianae]
MVTFEAGYTPVTEAENKKTLDIFKKRIVFEQCVVRSE